MEHIERLDQELFAAAPASMLTRRQFLRAVLAGGSALALPILAACDSGLAQPTPGAVATSAPPATPAATATTAPVATSAPPATPAAAATTAPAAVTSVPPATAQAVPSFPQPVTISSSGGQLNTQLTFAFQQLNVPAWGGTPTQLNLRTIGVPDPANLSQMLWGYPGPTLRMKPGDTLTLLLTNDMTAAADPTPPPGPTPVHDMSDTTNLHYHGLHVTPVAPGDDVLHINLMPTQSFTYMFTIPANQPGGTYWYHPHYHTATATQVLNGIAGALIIDGDFDTVPEIAQAQDIVLVIQEIAASQNDTGVILVNGAAQPTLQARPSEVQRWRFLAATMQATAIVELGLFPESSNSPDDTPLSALYQIAQDGIQFTNDQWQPDNPVESFVLAPGNRSDFLMQAPATPGRYLLRKRRIVPAGHNLPAPGATPGPFPTPRPGFLEEDALFTLEVVDDGTTDYPKKLPRQLPALRPDVAELLKPITDAEIAGRKRCLVFSFTDAKGNGGTFIDGQLFDPNVVNQTMQLNTAEEWTIYNVTTFVHPFHIHVNSFVVTKIHDPTNSNPQEIDTSPMTWQDTILLPPAKPTVSSCEDAGYVVIRHRFTDFTGQYVLHCHNLQHEDLGMMQVVQTTEGESDWQAHEMPVPDLGLPSCGPMS